MDNLDRAILEHLQALRAGMDRIEIQLSKLTGHVSGIEHQLVGIRVGVAGIHGGVAGMQARQERNDDSLLRIEKRLELVTH